MDAVRTDNLTPTQTGSSARPPNFGVPGYHITRMVVGWDKLAQRTLRRFTLLTASAAHRMRV